LKHKCLLTQHFLKNFSSKITTDLDRSSILVKVFNQAVGNSSYFEAIPHITHSLKICCGMIPKKNYYHCWQSGLSCCNSFSLLQISLWGKKKKNNNTCLKYEQNKFT